MLLVGFSISGSLSTKLLMEFKPLELICLDLGSSETDVASTGVSHTSST